jgi:hypothetical protein
MNKRPATSQEVDPKKLKSPHCLAHSTDLAQELLKEGHELDNIVVHLEPQLIITILNFQELLDEDDLSRLASVNWAWFMLFHGPRSLWLELAKLRVGKNKRGNYYGAKFTFIFPYFERKYGAERCPSALVFRLNVGLLAMCHHCGYDTQMQGKCNLPLSAFQEIGSSYQCINPQCRRELSEKKCGFLLSDVFAACANSVNSKAHAWREMDTEFLMPDSEEETIQTTFDYCERCGVLRRNPDSVPDEEDDNYCQECLEVECVCEPCPLCRKMPEMCKCETCDICNLCTGCKNCKKTCDCAYCETCDLPENECECSSEYDFV